MSRHGGRLALLVGATVVATAAVTLGTALLVQSHTRKRIAPRLEGDTAMLAAWLRDAPPADLQRRAVDAAAALDLRVTFLDDRGNVLADSALDPDSVARMENHADRPEIRQARLTATGTAWRRSASTNLDSVYCARRIPPVGAVAFVRVAVPSTAAGLLGPSGIGWTLAAFGMLCALLLLLGSAVLRTATEPATRLREAVEDATANPESVVSTDSAIPELRALAAAIEGMRRNLAARAAEGAAERRVLSSILAAMKQGLLVLGPDRAVRVANAAVRRILELDFDPGGRALEEVVRHPTVLADVDRCLARGEDREATFRLPGSGRTFELHVTPVGGESRREGALVLLFDVTQMEALEQVRREFVANVSHELRTPLTAIKAFVENLLDGALDDPANARRFLEIVDRHSSRMGELIEDLTDLSLIETGAVTLEPREVDAGPVAREAVEPLLPRAAERRVRIEVALPSPFPVLADRRRLLQILTNLVDNGVKFNREEGTVRIHGERDDAAVRIHVTDSGIGIPSDSLEKVFHRFYQVENDRSRKIRGTGLGLSIVRHLMRLHGGRVRVESELGRGSTFTLEFPRPAPRRADGRIGE